MDSIWLQRLQGQLCSLVAPAYLSLLNYRLFYFDRSTDPARPEYNEHCIFIFWHEYISVILPQWGHTPLTVLCSKHRDGEIVNQIALAQGFNIVRGSSSRGGSDAIRQLRKHSRFSSLGITPDGPRGPRREMAVGPIFLASLLQMPIVPVGIGVDRAWRLNTWDKFAIPQPYSNVRLILGPKIRLAKQLDREQLESSRRGVVNLMNDLSTQAQQWAESGLRIQSDQPCVRVRRCNKLVFPPPADQATKASQPASMTELPAATALTTISCRLPELVSTILQEQTRIRA